MGERKTKNTQTTRKEMKLAVPNIKQSTVAKGLNQKLKASLQTDDCLP